MILKLCCLSYKNSRDVVMAVMNEIDSEGVERRKKKCLKRRTYFSKVLLHHNKYFLFEL